MLLLYIPHYDMFVLLATSSDTVTLWVKKKKLQNIVLIAPINTRAPFHRNCRLHMGVTKTYSCGSPTEMWQPSCLVNPPQEGIHL